MTRTFAITLAALATVFAGCGGLGDPDANNDVLTTYSGSLTDPDGLTIEGELRVALIWFGGNFADSPPASTCHWTARRTSTC